jgi:hypothetical protein
MIMHCRPDRDDGRVGMSNLLVKQTTPSPRRIVTRTFKLIMPVSLPVSHSDPGGGVASWRKAPIPGGGPARPRLA